MSRFSPNSSQKSLWQFLIAPMLLVSLGLHILFLFIPIAASDEEAVPPTDPEEDSIAITRIPPSKPAQTDAGTQVAPEAQAVPPLSARTASAPRRQTSDSQRQQAANPRTNPRSTSPQTNDNVPDLRTDDSSAAAENPNPDPPVVDTPTPEPPSMVITPLPQEEAQKLLASLQVSDFIARIIPELRAKLKDLYGYSPKNTEVSEYGDNLEAWIAQVQQSTGSDIEQTVYRSDVEVIYERRVCFEPSPKPKATFGVLVDANGALQGEPKLLRSSGYQVLNEVALAAAKEEDFPEADETKAYTVDVDISVDYGRYECLEIQSAVAEANDESSNTEALETQSETEETEAEAAEADS